MQTSKDGPNQGKTSVPVALRIGVGRVSEAKRRASAGRGRGGQRSSRSGSSAAAPESITEIADLGDEGEVPYVAPLAIEVLTTGGNDDDGEAEYWGDELSQIAKVRVANGLKSATAGKNIKVAVRVRPQSVKEQKLGNEGTLVVAVDPTKGEILVHPGLKHVGGVRLSGMTSEPFLFDVALPMESSQVDVFEAIGVDVVACAYHGFNSSLFAYGQTSSGKSHCMTGIPGSSLAGLIPRIVRLLFLACEEASEREVLVECSYLEIYIEKLRDLLGDGKSGSLKVREDKVLGVHVAGLTREAVENEYEALAALEMGTRQRTTAATLYNAESSRSHSIFELNVQVKYKSAAGVDMRTTSRISLIDLAGSEKSKGSTGVTLKESNNINTSLTILGRCIRALVVQNQGKKNAERPPFRDSALTFYLRDSLAGNARTTMLATISPVRSNVKESLSTLRYAASAKLIKTVALKNEAMTKEAMEELSKEIARLRATMLAETKEKLERGAAERKREAEEELNREKERKLEAEARMRAEKEADKARREAEEEEAAAKVAAKAARTEAKAERLAEAERRKHEAQERAKCEAKELAKRQQRRRETVAVAEAEAEQLKREVQEIAKRDEEDLAQREQERLEAEAATEEERVQRFEKELAEAKTAEKEVVRQQAAEEQVIAEAARAAAKAEAEAEVARIKQVAEMQQQELAKQERDRQLKEAAADAETRRIAQEVEELVKRQDEEFARREEERLEEEASEEKERTRQHKQKLVEIEARKAEIEVRFASREAQRRKKVEEKEAAEVAERSAAEAEVLELESRRATLVEDSKTAITKSRRKTMEIRRKSVLLGGGGGGGSGGNRALDTSRIFAFPILSILTKDSALSHSLTIPLGGALPFSIGRDSLSERNDFELNGMGICIKHCQLAYRDEDDRESLEIRPLDSSASVLVNGSPVIFEGSEAGCPLRHLDRIILGPSRLVCLFLAEPLNWAERQTWTYEAAQAELAVLSLPVTLAPSRRAVLELFATVENETLAQANTIAVEMGTNIRFRAQVALIGSLGLHRADLSVDNFFESNSATVLVNCVVDPTQPNVTTTSMMRDELHRLLTAQKPKHASSSPERGGLETVQEEDEHDETNEVSLFSQMPLPEFDELLAILKISHTRLMALSGGLANEEGVNKGSSSGIGETPLGLPETMGPIASVFAKLDSVGRGSISRKDLARGIQSFSAEDADGVLDMVFIEDNLEEGAEVTFPEFERFLIQFMQHQCYRCLEAHVTNRDYFIKLGGRDLQGLALEVYTMRAEAKKAQLDESSLAIFESVESTLGGLAELTSSSITSIASVFSPW